YEPAGEPGALNPKSLSILERFTFPRQAKPPYLCLADYVRSVDSGVIDYVGMFAVVAGKNIRHHAR
ncbi:vitamin B12 dependent-methionine synthase activation domain-containing protein, partial [Heyndrickxia coagulans]|uniref:vitamin B12 dependent-methionine synthase activation domain-containing protein n=1 Tax=Heyndrickxia coagulans TaxID=1398 RepID=UPI002E1B504D